MKTLVFATTNAGKIAELRAMLGAEWVVKTAADFPHVADVDEDQATFEGNAAKKAHAFAKALGVWALADDSGLCVDHLAGRPGVQSARYAPTDAARIERLLGELNGAAPYDRSARFVCALCLAGPNGEEVLTRGTCEGTIGFEAKGSHGFGYDPVFYLPDGRSLAQVTREEKAAVSHRGAAFRQMLPLIQARVP